ncbi:uncharacterized protein LOC122032050 isoform X2 [Zingiber officinale]|uniref:uncharacterized protein LOC122032050 isoform X2 n=1 Tax=Zingiber officinale TaxID=94328 RepID=UPI001C4ACA44|nr:uncharacterized protein LOC122032050 isoform X2 [Zingiber officinale]
MEIREERRGKVFCPFCLQVGMGGFEKILFSHQSIYFDVVDVDGGHRTRQIHEPMPPPNQAGPSHVSSPPASYSPASVPMPPLHQSDPSHLPSASVSYSHHLKIWYKLFEK